MVAAGHVAGRVRYGKEPPRMVRAEFVTMLSIQEVLARFEGVGSCGKQWHACCPVHDDAHQSMTINVGDNEKILFHCKAGCSFTEIITAAGLTPKDVGGTGPGGHYGKKSAPKPSPRPGKKSVEEVTSLAAAAAEDAADPIENLARVLHVRPEALAALGVGYNADPTDKEPHWSFPERDADGNIIGINKRFHNGKKKNVGSTSRGLTYVPGVLNGDPDLVLFPEGGSDVAAMVSCGIAAVGRPGADLGIDHIVNLLAPHVHQKSQKDAKYVFVGEWDQKPPTEKHPHGFWPGRDGAIKTAQAVANRLGITTYWCMTPQGKLPKQPKDLRSIISSRYGYRTHDYYRALRAPIENAILADLNPCYPSQSTQIEEKSVVNPTEFVDKPVCGPHIHYHHDDHYREGDDYAPPGLSTNFLGDSLPSQREQEWGGTRLDATRTLPEIEDDLRFRKDEFCNNGITALLLGVNRMAKKLACVKLGCEKIAVCLACACRARLAKYQHCSACFSKAMAAGATIYFRYIKPEYADTVHKAVTRAGYEYKDIELSNGAVLMMIAPTTENGVVLAHKKPPPGFAEADDPHKLLHLAVANMNVHASTPVSSSRGWEYKPPAKEQSWKFVALGSASYAKITWKMQDHLFYLSYNKLGGDKLECSVTGTLPPHWTEDMIQTAILWIAMGEDIPADWHRPNLIDLAGSFADGWTREAA